MAERVKPDLFPWSKIGDRGHGFLRSTILAAIDAEIAHWNEVNAPDDNNEQWALEQLRARFEEAPDE